MGGIERIILDSVNKVLIFRSSQTPRSPNLAPYMQKCLSSPKFLCPTVEDVNFCSLPGNEL